MTMKSTYEELEERVKQLEKEAVESMEAKKRLQESEDRYRTLVETIPYGIQEIDTSGVITLGNDAYFRLMGYEKGELLGKAIWELIEFETGSGKEELQEYLNLLVKDQPSRTPFFQRNRKKDGKVIDTQVDWNYKRNEQGLVTGFISVLTDITVRKRAEEALQTEIGKLETITQNIGAGLCIISRDYRTLWANQVLKQIFGEVEGKVCYSTYNQLPDVCPNCGVREVFETGKSEVKHEEVGKDAKGQTIWSEIIVTPIRDKEGNIMSALELFVPITERKQAEEELKRAHSELEIRVAERTADLEKANMALQAEIAERKRMGEDLKRQRELLQAIVDKIPVMITMYNPQANIMHVNKAFEDIIGWSNDEIQAIDLMEECYPDPEYRRKAWEYMQALTIEWREFKVRTKEGGVVESIWSNVKLWDDTQIGIGIDVTDRKRAEEEKKKLEAQLRQAQKMEAIATLAGGIAHQFNNALSGITVNLDMIEMDSPDHEAITGYIEQMRRSAHRMTQLTSQLLAYARGGKYQAKIISLSRFVRDTLPIVEHILKPSIYVETDLPHDILSVKADIIQLQMVLSAILSNASEAIEGQGRIRITCRNELITDESANDFPDLKPGPYVSLKIADNGKGMDELTKSQVFEPFFTTKFQGRGLGMAAVYGIIKNHDGWISVDSELGKGARVSIYLPTIDEKIKEEEKPKIDLPKGTGTILVIEDEEMVMDVIRGILKRLGYQVLEAKTGHDAINIVKTFDGDIDVAILDIILPDMHGREVYRKIIEARQNLNVIVCSGYTIEGPAQEILDAGAQGFIKKPFSFKKLSETLKEVSEM